MTDNVSESSHGISCFSRVAVHLNNKHSNIDTSGERHTACSENEMVERKGRWQL